MLMVLPTLIAVGLVVAYPLLRSVLFAFQDIRLVDIPRLSLLGADATLDNFRDVLQASGFWSAMRTTVVYAAACTAGTLGLGLATALAFRGSFRGRGPLRAVILVPYVLPVVAATTMWKTLLNPQFGPINALGMRFFGWDEPVNFLSRTSVDVSSVSVPVALSTVIVFELWKTTPLAFLFITARLQTISKDLEEAATLDGATPSQLFRHVILPELKGVLVLLALLRFIWSFQNFNDIYLLTGGAAGTEVVAVRVYNELIRRADVGTASATGLVMTAVLIVVLAVYLRVDRRMEDR